LDDDSSGSRILPKQLTYLLIEFIPGYFWYYYKSQSLIALKITTFEILNTILAGVLGVSPTIQFEATDYTLSFLFSHLP
jgi:hypothetical protein